MEEFLNNLEIVKKEQKVVDTYWVHDCLNHYRPVAGVGGGTSIASMTSPSDTGSVSRQSSHKTGASSVAETVASESVAIVTLWQAKVNMGPRIASHPELPANAGTPKNRVRR
ncbi:hypothetical protein PG984_011866 [Apiospora sp. TS-2023a]